MSMARNGCDGSSWLQHGIGPELDASGRAGGEGGLWDPGRDTLEPRGTGIGVRGGGRFVAYPAALTSGHGWKVITWT